MCLARLNVTSPIHSSIRVLVCCPNRPYFRMVIHSRVPLCLPMTLYAFHTLCLLPDQVGADLSLTKRPVQQLPSVMVGALSSRPRNVPFAPFDGDCGFVRRYRAFRPVLLRKPLVDDPVVLVSRKSAASVGNAVRSRYVVGANMF